MLDLRGRCWLKPLREYLGADTFIETGCYKGDGIAAAIASGFTKIDSCDIDLAAVETCRARFKGDDRVLVRHAPSPRFLTGFYPPVFRERPAVFWLDAHWWPGLGPKPPSYVCPLLEELRIVGQFVTSQTARACILIDDLCAFNEPELAFPPLETVLRCLAGIGQSIGRHEIRVLDSHVERNVLALIPVIE